MNTCRQSRMTRLPTKRSLYNALANMPAIRSPSCIHAPAAHKTHSSVSTLPTSAQAAELYPQQSQKPESLQSCSLRLFSPEQQSSQPKHSSRCGLHALGNSQQPDTSPVNPPIIFRPALDLYSCAVNALADMNSMTKSIRCHKHNRPVHMMPGSGCVSNGTELTR